MKIDRYDARALERLESEMRRQAQHIAEEFDLGFADQPAAHPGPEQVVRRYGRP